MADLLTTVAPLLGFMLIPVWIPLVTALVGVVADRFRPARPSATRRAVDAAKAISAEAHRKAAFVSPHGASAAPGRTVVATDSVAA